MLLLPFFVSFVIRTLPGSSSSPTRDRARPSQELGLLPQSFHVLSTSWAVIAGLTYNAFPFMVLPLYVALERIDRRVRRGPPTTSTPITPRTFLRVILPLSAPGIFAGFLLVFVTNVGDYVNAADPRRPRHDMIGNVIQDAYFTNQDYPIASALSSILMLILLVVDLAVRADVRHRQRSRSTADEQPSSSAGRRAIAAPAAAPQRSGELSGYVLPAFVWLVILWTIVPIVVMIIFSFNQAPNGRLAFHWYGLHHQWYRTCSTIGELTRRWSTRWRSPS